MSDAEVNAYSGPPLDRLVRMSLDDLKCRDCGCPNADHNDPFIGGCTNCGDCGAWS